MVCKFEMISENEVHEIIYICDKYGDSNRIICNKKIQPHCYEEKKTVYRCLDCNRVWNSLQLDQNDKGDLMCPICDCTGFEVKS